MLDYSIDLTRMQHKKLSSLDMAAAFERIADSVVCSPGPSRYRWRGRAAACRSCGTFLKFAYLQNGDSKLLEANFCKLRLCPQCSFRRSLKTYSNISAVLDYLEPHNYKYLFLTLTVKNVLPVDLGDSLSMMAAGFHRFINNDAISRRVYGFIRSTEVTFNQVKGTLHPHYHLIVAVDQNYDRKSDEFLRTDQWADSFGKACRLDYHPITDIRTIKGNLQDGLKEVSKYAVKEASWMADRTGCNDEIIYFLHRGLHRKRLLSYTGVFAQARKELKLLDEDTNLTDQLMRDDVILAMIKYRWNYGIAAYEIVEVDEIENEEK